MPLVRSQEDEFHHIESGLDATSIARWRVSTSRSRRSSDLCSSLKAASCSPRSASKTASWTSGAHRVARLERIQEDEDDDEYPTYQYRLPRIPMKANDQTDEVAEGGYMCPVWPPDDGLDQAHSTVLNSPTHDLANPFRLPFYDSDDVLHRCRRDPRNIVLDSVHPEITPHIIITPPEFDWTDFSTIHGNTIPPQQYPEYYLCVPVLGHTSLLATVPPTEGIVQSVQAKVSVTDSEVPEGGTRAHHVVLTNAAQAMRVFSPSLFQGTVEAASQERELMPHLLRSLYKRLFSACAAIASDVAHKLRSRYPSSTVTSELFSLLETPAAWSDPALPLLSYFFRLPGTLIIDSATPFITPHIVITEPPIWDYNPYVNIHNSTQSPQDAGWGQSLIVPSPVVDFVNLPEDAPYESAEPVSGESVMTQYAESETGCDTWEPGSPSEDSVVESPDSPVLQTPGLLTPIGEEEEFDLMMFASPLHDSRLSLVDEHDLLLEDAPQDIEVYCDDEDDDLPPLDGWYQDIAARSGYILSA